MPAALILLLEIAKTTLTEYVEYVTETLTAPIDILGSRLVILCFLLGVRQHIIGLLYFLEPILIPAAIRMVLHGQSSIGLFDFNRTGSFGHSQDSV